jgi:2,5-diamino-6-(ribosylamino)-4(3H)-pyrimidinone 5'-phosphate reductase
MSQNPPEFLTTLLGSRPILTPDDTTRPYVTLTFAQSLDAKIAGRGGQQLVLSGPESFLMTHWYGNVRSRRSPLQPGEKSG